MEVINGLIWLWALIGIFFSIMFLVGMFSLVRIQRRLTELWEIVHTFGVNVTELITNIEKMLELQKKKEENKK